MQRDDLKRFAAIFAAMAEYYGKELSVAAIEMYRNGLDFYSIEDIDRAAALHMRNPETGSFFPKISDFVRLIEGGTQDRAAIAWSKVERASARVGSYDSLVFDDPLIHAVLVDMGGFASICASKVTDMPFRARDFEARYRAYSSRAEMPAYPAKIIGTIEADCLARGYPQWIPHPIFIGDVGSCEKVLTNGGKTAFEGQKTIGNSLAEAMAA